MSETFKRIIELMSQLPKELREIELIRLEASADALTYMRRYAAKQNSKSIDAVDTPKLSENKV